MKLNMGAGLNKMPGWINVDKAPAAEPDVICDLEHFPRWPWPTSSVAEVLFQHSLEHMGETAAGFRHVVEELYRICADGALVRIVAPHPRHDDFLNDPTHVRAITPEILGLLSRETCAKVVAAGAANSPLALYWGVDFRLEGYRFALDPAYPRCDGVADEQAYWERAAKRHLNVVKEVQAELRVVKPAGRGIGNQEPGGGA